MTRRSGRRDPAMLEVDRFLVSDDPGILGYFRERLFVAHGRGERLRWSLAGRLGGPFQGRLLGGGRRRLRPEFLLDRGSGQGAQPEVGRWEGTAGLLAAASAIDEASVAAALNAVHRGRAILLRDYDDAGRDGVLVFPFEPDAREPATVLKLRHSGGAAPLAGERDALLHLARALPAGLAATVPAVLAHQDAPGVEVLVLSHLSGRSAYVELRNAYRPADHVRVHFEAAAKWLAQFHLATRSGHGDGEPLPDSMGHGDFWARNLLIAGGPAGAPAARVVDWEHFRPRASPLDDLFHFPLSYGRSYRWRGYAPTTLSDAFHATFLGDTPVSRATWAYLRAYSERAGLDPERLRPLLREHLRRRAAGEAAARGEELLACAAALDRARPDTEDHAGAAAHQ